jgi:hypothetical protein
MRALLLIGAVIGGMIALNAMTVGKGAGVGNTPEAAVVRACVPPLGEAYDVGKKKVELGGGVWMIACAGSAYTATKVDGVWQAKLLTTRCRDC